MSQSDISVWQSVVDAIPDGESCIEKIHYSGQHAQEVLNRGEDHEERLGLL